LDGVKVVRQSICFQREWMTTALIKGGVLCGSDARRTKNNGSKNQISKTHFLSR